MTRVFYSRFTIFVLVRPLDSLHTNSVEQSTRFDQCRTSSETILSNKTRFIVQTIPISPAYLNEFSKLQKQIKKRKRKKETLYRYRNSDNPIISIPLLKEDNLTISDSNTKIATMRCISYSSD